MPDDTTPADTTSAALGAAEVERDEYKAALIQLTADFSNYKRRTAALSAESADAATSTVLRSLLPILDALDLAEAHEVEPTEFEPVHRLLRTTLSDAGLARIDAIGTTFDPTEHEAVEHVILDTPTKEPGQVVVGVLRPGYRWNTTLLRPATVRVGEHAS